LRDTSNGAGIISSQGQQYEFRLEGVWKSDVPPIVNNLVEFELDATGLPIAVYALGEGQLAREQADQLVGAFKVKSLATYADWSSRLGKPTLLAIAALAAAWFFLNVVSVQVTQSMSHGISFWKLLGIVNAANSLAALEGMGAHLNAGVYGFMALITLAGPLLSQFWKDPRAHLGGALPLLFMLTVAVALYLNISSGMGAASEAGAMFGGAEATKLAQNMVSEMLKAALDAVHLGLGAYVALLAASYLAFTGTTRFLAANA
jgi:hypothetical protein